jgi:hypothetical protein
MTAAHTPGYSGKPLADKLGIKPSMRVAVVHGPKEFAAWLAPLPADARLLDARAKNVGCAMLFVTRSSELVRDIAGVLKRLDGGGMCWICWPKKSSGVATDVTETLLRDVVLPTGWVDVKVCAVSDIWSGLKFLRRCPR